MPQANVGAQMGNWRDSITDEQAAAAAKALQARLDSDPPGKSWTGTIGKLAPQKRLEMTLEYLPLPAAFNEAAIALRALIAGHMEEQRDPSASLKLLYWLSAVASFMPDQAEKAQTPGFSVFATIPGARLFGLKFDWKTLDYEKLPLLVGRDVRMLIALWGQPLAHSTLLEQHPELWDEYEAKLTECIRNSDRAFAEQLAQSLDAAGGVPLPIRLANTK